MKNENKQHFVSSDFYLAAFLRTCGLRLLSVDKNNPQRALFIFEERPGRQSLVEDFMFGRAHIEPKNFVAAIRELKQLLHSYGEV